MVVRALLCFPPFPSVCFPRVPLVMVGLVAWACLVGSPWEGRLWDQVHFRVFALSYPTDDYNIS